MDTSNQRKNRTRKYVLIDSVPYTKHTPWTSLYCVQEKGLGYWKTGRTLDKGKAFIVPAGTHAYNSYHIVSGFFSYSCYNGMHLQAVQLVIGCVDSVLQV